MRIILTLREIMNEGLGDKFGYDPYCMAEGADGNQPVEVKYNGDIDWDKVERID
jgi:hypothetical protein